MQPVAQRHRAGHRPRRQALRDNRRLLRIAPAPPPRRPAQNLHPAETVPINWQITWHTIPLPWSIKAASPHRHHPAQGAGQAPLTMLSPQLLELLRTWWREGRRRSLLLPGGWLFPGRNPVEPLSARQLGRVVRAAAQAAGITKRVSPHTLRHSFATHLLEQGVDIRVIQTLLGHAKLDTTALYTRVANTTIRAVTSPLDRLASSIEEM